MDELIGIISSFKFWIGIGLGLIPFMRQKFLNYNDRRKAFKWLKENSSDKEGNKFRSTVAICNGININKERVINACYSSVKIRRNAGEKETWTIFSQKEDKIKPGVIGVDWR